MMVNGLENGQQENTVLFVKRSLIKSILGIFNKFAGTAFKKHE